MLKIEKIQAVLADQRRPVKSYLKRKDLTELMINRDGYVYIEANGLITYEDKLLSSMAIDMVLTAVVKFVGKDALAGSKSAPVGANIENMHIAGGRKRRPVLMARS